MKGGLDPDWEEQVARRQHAPSRIDVSLLHYRVEQLKRLGFPDFQAAVLADLPDVAPRGGEGDRGGLPARRRLLDLLLGGSSDSARKTARGGLRGHFPRMARSR